MTVEPRVRPDHNSLGKGAFIVGLVGLVLAFVPFIGFVSWLLGPLAIVLGGIACMKPKRSLAIAGIITGALALFICFGWLNMTKSVGEAMNRDTFNTTGAAATPADAPIMEATISGVWDDIEANKVAAGQKYGGHRLRFTDEAINDFTGDAAAPGMNFEGNRADYMIYYVGASFAAADGAKIAQLAKGQKVSFVCGSIREGFGEGYSLGDCTLEP
jgi:hypothetical protein